MYNLYLICLDPTLSSDCQNIFLVRVKVIFLVELIIVCDHCQSGKSSQLYRVEVLDTFVGQPEKCSLAKKEEEIMKILVVGSGGREHAIAWALLQSPNVEQVFCAPGNGGTATMANCQNLDLAVDDFPGIAKTVRDYDIFLVAVGPEVPLSLGLSLIHI